MSSSISRRGFLKLASLLPMTYFVPRSSSWGDLNNLDGLPNILVVVFDTLSALHTPFDGYPRNTMPYLSELASHAYIFHNHYAGGNFTTPGTATLLTGTYPWTNRGFKNGSVVDSSFEDRNLFSLFDEYYRISYSHNPLVNTLQAQFHKHLDFLKPRRDLTFGIGNRIGKLFKNDDDTFSLGWNRSMNKRDDGFGYSLLLSEFYGRVIDSIFTQFGTFPRGLPEISETSYFLLEKAIDWAVSELQGTQTPFLGYFHFLPPHEPYNTRQEFINLFASDGFYQPANPPSPWGNPFFLEKYQLRMRQRYDEFIPYADFEFNRFYNELKNNGVLDNTILIFTSDHGEIFDRGMIGHMTPMLYQPLVKIPLVVFMPGHTGREDIYANTSAADILPTLLHLTGKSIPSWIEGEILPPFNPKQSKDERSIYSFEAKQSEFTGPLNPASAMIVKGDYKFTFYHGYDPVTGFEELFNLADDPQETNQIKEEHPDIATSLLEELNQTIEEANEPYNQGEAVP